MINVTKTFLPPLEEYTKYLERVWENGWVTNNGELVQELEQKLKQYLGVKHLLFCANGTIVLQMAIKALGLSGEIITTPFSYVATANAIAWEGCTPVFVDIEPQTFTLDPEKMEAAITPRTQAILATHVYGFPCKIEAIQAIAQKHGLKVIYDGAHAFGSRYRGKSLLAYGDISTCSFHATKLFHTAEGGCVVTDDDGLFKKLELFRQFGHAGDDYFSIGINAKNSELHAAMGLAVLPRVAGFIEERKHLIEAYGYELCGAPLRLFGVEAISADWNHSYFPIIFKSAGELSKAKGALQANGIFPRRYFFPSLHNLPFLDWGANCPHSGEISNRVLCLPLFNGMDTKLIVLVSSIIKGALA